MLRVPPFIISNAYPGDVGQHGPEKFGRLSWSSHVHVGLLFLHFRKCLPRTANTSEELLCLRYPSVLWLHSTHEKCRSHQGLEGFYSEGVVIRGRSGVRA